MRQIFNVALEIVSSPRALRFDDSLNDVWSSKMYFGGGSFPDGVSSIRDF